MSTVNYNTTLIYLHGYLNMGKIKEKYSHRPLITYPLEVGTFYPKMLTYNDCNKDSDGYIDPTIYLPFPLDLVCLIVERNKKKLSKNITGWWTGTHWDGARILPGDNILKWKRKDESTEY